MRFCRRSAVRFIPSPLASTPEVNSTNTFNSETFLQYVGLFRVLIKLYFSYWTYCKKVVFISVTFYSNFATLQLCLVTMPLLGRRTVLTMIPVQMSCWLMNSPHSQVSQGIYFHLQSHRPASSYYISVMYASQSRLRGVHRTDLFAPANNTACPKSHYTLSKQLLVSFLGIFKKCIVTFGTLCIFRTNLIGRISQIMNNLHSTYWRWMKPMIAWGTLLQYISWKSHKRFIAFCVN